MRRLFLRGSILATVLVVALTLACGGGAPAGERGTAFFGDIEDLPLMPGLEETAEGGMVFDTPSGRIVEAYAAGPVTRDQVLNFYAVTLPQLGWSRAGATRFRREGETLELHFSDSAAARGLTVRFALLPTRGGEPSR